MVWGFCVLDAESKYTSGFPLIRRSKIGKSPRHIMHHQSRQPYCKQRNRKYRIPKRIRRKIRTPITTGISDPIRNPVGEGGLGTKSVVSISRSEARSKYCLPGTFCKPIRSAPRSILAAIVAVRDHRLPARGGQRDSARACVALL